MGKPNPRRRPRSRRRDTGARRPKSTAIQSPTAEELGSPLDAGAPRAAGGEEAGGSPEESGVALEISLAYCNRGKRVKWVPIFSVTHVKFNFSLHVEIQCYLKFCGLRFQFGEEIKITKAVYGLQFGRGNHRQMRGNTKLKLEQTLKQRVRVR